MEGIDRSKLVEGTYAVILKATGGLKSQEKVQIISVDGDRVEVCDFALDRHYVDINNIRLA